MTRDTKLEKKKYEKAAGFEEFNIKPLQTNRVVKQDNSEIKEVPKQKNKRKSREEGKPEPSHSEVSESELEKSPEKKRKLDKKRTKPGKKINNAEIRSKRSETRRLRRIKERQNKTICFGCRKNGHSVKDCPEAKEQGVGMCYNCGSTEHFAKDCKKSIKQGSEYLYAKCFICNEQGHLSKQCPKNEKGLYPNGGSCRFCNQITHLAKDCKLKNEDNRTHSIGKLNLQHGADDDDFHIQILEKPNKKVNVMKAEKNKSKKKIVKF